MSIKNFFNSLVGGSPLEGPEQFIGPEAPRSVFQTMPDEEFHQKFIAKSSGPAPTSRLKQLRSRQDAAAAFSDEQFKPGIEANTASKASAKTKRRAVKKAAKSANQKVNDIPEIPVVPNGADKSNNTLASNGAIDYLKEDFNAFKKAGSNAADQISGSKKLAEEARAASVASGAGNVEEVVKAAKSERTMGKIGGELIHDLGRGNKMAGGAKLGAYMAGTAVLANMLNPFGD